MENSNFAQINLKPISIEDMTEISGGNPYGDGYGAGRGAAQALTVIGIFLLFM